MTRTIEKHGFKIDVAQIADGIWDMMPEEDRLPLVVGMMPKHWNDRVEKLLIEKIGDHCERHYGVRPHQSYRFQSFALEPSETFAEFVREIMHEFYLAMLDCAKHEGMLVCSAYAFAPPIPHLTGNP